ncbi:VWA domain-containing protein [Streptomyces ziwulingensis]|uniref:VWFA domain-containing protein n=1 Tax=Streptomyces ziwulingensis TaxID=1045501 RepID=A0ABP9BJ15_9ACTN
MGILTLLRNAFGRSRKARAAQAEETTQETAPSREPSPEPTKDPTVPSQPTKAQPPEPVSAEVPEPRKSDDDDGVHDLVTAAFDNVTVPSPTRSPESTSPSDPASTQRTEATTSPSPDTDADSTPGTADTAAAPDSDADSTPPTDTPATPDAEPASAPVSDTATTPEATVPAPEPSTTTPEAPEVTGQEAAAPEPAPEPEPEPELEPEAVTEPEPEAAPQSEPEAKPTTATEPEQIPQPEAETKPEPEPEARPEPAPEPAAEVVPEPEPKATIPAPEPTPGPVVEPTPEPEAKPKAATPVPTPEPESEPAPADGEDAPQGPPAPDDESRTGGAGGNTQAEGESEAESEAESETPPTTLAPHLLTPHRTAATTLAKHNLTHTRAKIYLVLDRSASMRPYYKDGSAQSLAEQTLALAANLDPAPDTTVHVTFFSTEVDGTGELTLTDHENKIDTLHAELGRMGRTSYHAAVAEVIATHEKSADPSAPALVVFQTDGAPDAKTPATQSLADAAKDHPGLFFSFVVFGDPENKAFDYLRKLKTGNTSCFFAGETPRELTDEELYEGVLASWRP